MGQPARVARRHCPANEHASEGDYRGSVHTDPEQLSPSVALSSFAQIERRDHERETPAVDDWDAA
jgi:hypothetical protein